MKTSEIADMRALLQGQQNDMCAICGGKFYAKMPLDPVLDHNHKTGAIRGVIHRGCNSMLGKVENYQAQSWVRDLKAWLPKAGAYKSSADPAPGVLHPAHRTPAEKAERTKVRAKRRRVAAKKAKA